MLPKMIDPRRNADQNIEYRGSLQASLLDRLESAVDSVNGDVRVSLRLFRDEQRRMRIQGDINADVNLICQRCLQISSQALEAKVDLVMLFSDDQAKTLSKDMDFWLVDDSANLHELIEDELLLAMPIVAYHADNSCEPPGDYQSMEPEKEQERQSPFAILKELTDSSD